MSGLARVAAMFFVAIESFWQAQDNTTSSSGIIGHHGQDDSSNLVIGLILARAGSKGIPQKNLAILDGHPLIHWALEAMFQSGVFHSIWVSTDDPAIKEYVKLKKGIYVHDRADYTATDEATSISAAQEFIISHPEIEMNILCLVQATSPFIQAKYLIDGYNLITHSDYYDSVFSVTRQYKLRWSEINNKKNTLNGYSKALNFNPFLRPRRQDWSGELIENGMFYFTRKELLLSGAFQGERSNYVEIPKEHSLEIDSPEDLIFANILLSERTRTNGIENGKLQRNYITVETEKYKEEL